MHNIKLIVAYDGKAYHGWQKTKMGPSIEAVLQSTIEQILQHPTPLQAASRTDAGVHAKGQVVNFITSKKSFDFYKFQNSLNCLLPKDIRVLTVQDMPITFHPTLDCIGKEYRYFVDFGHQQLPHHRFYSWYIPYRLDIESMQQALPYFKGIHHFASFCNVKKNAHYVDYIRNVQVVDIFTIEDNQLYIRICGNHFLYKMARNLVGTLVDVGRGKIQVDSLPNILQSGRRALAGVTAPAHGLFLHQVFY